MKIIRRFLRKLLLNLDSMLLKEDFVVISNNCFGAEVYRRLGKAYNTPFVGLFLMADHYIKLLENFEFYMNKDLTFRESLTLQGQKNKDYPIGYLNDIEIHFMHYKSITEAKEKWERRSKRMLQSSAKRFFKFDDRDGATEEHFKRFNKLNFKHKIAFSLNPEIHYNTITVKESGKNLKTVPDGVALYNVCFRYVDYYFWLRNGKIKYSYLAYLRSKLGLI